MITLTCPYCYNSFSGRSMKFQCLRRRDSLATPGQKCPMSVNETRQRWTGHSEPSALVFPPPLLGVARTARCPGCSDPTGARACPTCETPFPANFGYSRSPLITVIGVKSSGKSVYLKMLTHELVEVVSKRFRAKIEVADDRKEVGAFDEIVDKGRLPDGTDRQRTWRRDPLMIEWRGLGHRWPRKMRSNFLSFYDTAGEDDLNNLAFLTASDALMLVIDPLTFPEALEQKGPSPTGSPAGDSHGVDPAAKVKEFTSLVRKLRGLTDSQMIDIPVAVVLTKIDAFFTRLEGHPVLQVPEARPFYDETVGAQTDLYVQQLLEAWGAWPIDIHLHTNLSNYRYFAVSALGAEPKNNAVDPAGTQPFRVEEPLLWLLSQRTIGIVAKSGRIR